MLYVVIALIVVLFAWYLSFSAARLDRLHHRAETSLEHLDALLQRRAALALEITHTSNLDPASAFMLTQSAYLSRETAVADRGDAELSLSQSLALIQEAQSHGDLEVDPTLLHELADLTDKLHISIELHLEAVASVEKMRARAICKVFKLAGRAKLPIKYSFEDKL